MKILERTSSKTLIKYVLESKKELKIEESKIAKIDFIAKNKNMSSCNYGITVRYRNIPCTETRSQVFENKDLQEIKDACASEKLIPVIAFALFDEETNKTYAFLFTISQMEELAKDDTTEKFFKQVMHGLEIKIGTRQTVTNEILLKKLKAHVDYTEIENNGRNFFE